MPVSLQCFWETNCCFRYTGMRIIFPVVCFFLPLQNLERNEAQHKAEVELIKEQLKELRQKADHDKEALKKALRAQKERAERSEEYAEQLTVQLAEKVFDDTGAETSFQIMCLNL